jgi:hypothetical protein
METTPGGGKSRTMNTEGQSGFKKTVATEKDWAVEWRASVLDCGSPLPLYTAGAAMKKRQRAAAVQDAGAQFDCPSIYDDYGIFETALTLPPPCWRPTPSAHSMLDVECYMLNVSSSFFYS